MSETEYNPDDPAFLLSRSLDEVLPAGEQRRLDEALASSKSLQSEAQQLRAVDRMLKRWGRTQVELDWDHQAALVRARAESDGDSEELRKVDRLLERWGGQSVSFDAERFTTAVMARVGRARTRPSRYGLIFRVGAPLAAAAVVVFAVTSGFGPDRAPTSKDVAYPGGEPVCQVVFGPGPAGTGPSSGESAPLSAVGGRFGSEPVVLVAFVRSPLIPGVKGQSIGAEAGAKGGSTISFGAVGAAPIGVGGNEGPTL